MSNSGTPVDESRESSSFISVSTTFYPGANTDSFPTDLIILSSDAVFFYVHSRRLVSASENAFNMNLPQAIEKIDGNPEPILNLPDSASVMNIVLHTVYGMSCSHYSPTFSDVAMAIAALKVYGLPLNRFLSPASPLSATLSSFSTVCPLDLYTLAAAHDLHDLAVTASPHLLSLALPTVTDEIALMMGPVYLKKLFFLHFGRTDALKRLLLPPPSPHSPTADCDFVEQKKVTRAWALASAYLTWDARPDMPTGTIEGALQPLSEHLACEQCRTALRGRIQELVDQWAAVKVCLHVQFTFWLEH